MKFTWEDLFMILGAYTIIHATASDLEIDHGPIQKLLLGFIPFQALCLFSTAYITMPSKSAKYSSYAILLYYLLKNLNFKKSLN